MDRKENNMIAKILEVNRVNFIILVRVLFGETEKTLRFNVNAEITEIENAIKDELNRFIEAENKKNELNVVLLGKEITI